MKRLGTILAFILVSFASASDISWKTFDIKTGPAIGVWLDMSSSMAGWSLSIIKPLTPYVGVGVMAEVGGDLSGCEDCVNYDFAEFSEGFVVNMNAPLGKGFSLVSNFMFLVNFQDGTVEGGYDYNEYSAEAYDADGERISVYEREYDDGDYYHESVMLRSNLGFAWRTKSNFFGLEFYPLDIAYASEARVSCSLNAVFRVF